MAFQVVIPELGRGFDRIECAQSARALAGPGSRIAVAPVAAVVEPIAVAAAAPVTLAALRPLSQPVATLGLLAAGTAAAALLWLRVLGTDPAGFPLIRGDAPQAAAGETVEAGVSESPGDTATPLAEPANPRADTPRRILVAATAPARDAAGRSTAGGEPPRVARRPSDERGGSQGGGKHAAKGNGKGHKGKGLGHVKHGDTNGQHSPGHGSSQGASSSHAHGQSAGHSKSHRHGKKH
jgi:hypothetical protein